METLLQPRALSISVSGRIHKPLRQVSGGHLQFLIWGKAKQMAMRQQGKLCQLFYSALNGEGAVNHPS